VRRPTHRIPAAIEAIENRVLFAFDVTAGSYFPGQPQLVFTDIATGNTNGSGATSAQTVTFKNSGAGNIVVTGIGLADDPSISGDQTPEFILENAPAAGTILGPGQTFAVNVRFQAASVGLKAAFLRISSTSSPDPTLDVALRGIGTSSDSSGEVSGSNEASLQRILHAFQIPIVVGDANGEDTFDLPTPRPAGTPTDEVEMQRLRKAGGGPVVIQSLAEYAFNTKTGPVGHFGYYTPGTKDAKNELFAVDVSQRTSTTPTWGASFDPGSADFALYGDFNGSIFEINGLPRGVYSEDSLNTWDAANKKKVRFFPLKNKDGSVVPNAFVFAFEEFNSGYDSNDVVGIIRNVQAAPAGPEVGTESLDRGMPGPTRLVMNRIQIQPPDPRKNEDGTTTPLPNNVVHDKAKVRVYNTGSSNLAISSVVLSNSDFQINTAGLNGSTISPGQSKDIEVQFIATSGHIHNATLTINTNDSDEPTTVIQLAGYWQSKSENNEEPKLPELVNQLMGFNTTIVNSGQQLTNPATAGKVEAVGDEILSPYWRRVDAARAVEVIQLNAYHTHNAEAVFKWHLQGSTSTSTLFAHEAVDAQSMFPHLKGSSTAIAAGTFKPTKSGDSNPAFGFRVDNEWSDPTLNVQEQAGGGFGHHVRFWPLKDSSGKVVPDTYLLAMDYQGINYDYQDNIYVIRNIRPASGTTPPATPAGLSATGTESGIALNWNDNTDANLAGYNIYRGTSSDFIPSASNKLNGSPLTASDYNDANAPTGSTSFYKVMAVNTSGVESTAATASATRTGTTPTAPATPASISASAASTTAINITWSPSSGATTYFLERRVAGESAFNTVSSALTTTSYSDAGLAPNTTYEYRVSAVNAQGASAPTNIASAKTQGVTAGNPTASITNASVNEPTSGTVNATFTVTLNAAATAPIVINYATADATATAADYAGAVGAITFGVGETSKIIDIPVLADGIDESNETFIINLSVASGPVTLADAQGVGTILSGSAPPPPPSIQFGGKTRATFTGTDGKPVKISIKGPGVGEVIPPDGAGGGAIISITGTTTASATNISGTTQVSSVNVNGDLKSFGGKSIDLTGNVAITGGVTKFTARNASGAHSINIGTGAPVSLTFGNLADISLSSGSAIKSLRANQWVDTDSTPEALTAPSVGTMTLKGDLMADLLVGSLSRLSVKGALSGSDIRSTSDIGTVRATAARNSLIFAGVKNSVSALPASLSDLETAAAIKSVSISGKTPGSFSDTLIAARDLGKVSLGSVATENGGAAFGVSGDNIASVRGTTTGGQKLSGKMLSDSSNSSQDGDFLLRVL
jgi:hypothetical protein